MRPHISGLGFVINAGEILLVRVLERNFHELELQCSRYSTKCKWLSLHVELYSAYKIQVGIFQNTSFSYV